MAREWTIQEDDFIRENFQTMKSNDIAVCINRTRSAVKNRVHKLGLKLDRSSITPERLSQFKKGSVPMNKGVKMPAHIYEKVKKTMFRKGNKPHNTRIEGEFSDRYDKTGAVYRYIKIKDAHWVLYHRFIWEQVHGPIPPDHVVMFIDGNTLNCAIENLKLITLAENVIRNSLHQYPKEVKDLIKLKNKLKKEIENYDN